MPKEREKDNIATDKSKIKKKDNDLQVTTRKYRKLGISLESLTYRLGDVE